jgi:NAD-dependent deacetylase
MQDQIKKAAAIIKASECCIAFCGAGISLESGIPTFRGEGGIWNQYDPACLEISNYFRNPVESWKVIKEIFYDSFGKAVPNPAHIALAELEKMNLLEAVITQNIDNLHHEAGSKMVYEFHGNSRTLVCTECEAVFEKTEVNLDASIPLCLKCNSLLKPNFIFFGEGIPEPAGSKSFELAEKCDVILVIGTTGEVMPACNIPYVAKRNGAKVIEINPGKSAYTGQITDIYLAGKAGEILPQLVDFLKS